MTQTHSGTLTFPASGPSHRAWWLLFCLVLSLAESSHAQVSGDLFRFFAEEALGVTASRIPQADNRPPATVYVVSDEQLRHAGAQNLWDPLRAVPGVDVALFRTLQGGVSIRGLNKSFNSRTLVLVDGVSTSLGSNDQSLWEIFPVLLTEVERIEVVQGPVSALYGANALNGVINIVTKKPEQLAGGLLSLGAGDRQTGHASLLYGRSRGNLGYKGGLSWRTTNRFEDADRRAGFSYRGSGQLAYSWGPRSRLSLTGGLTSMDIEGSWDWLSLTQSKGEVGFLRAEALHHRTHAQAFWSMADIDLGFTFYERQTQERDRTYDLSVDQLIPLSGRSTAVVGAGFRATEIRSSYVSASSSLWSAFAEHRWQPAPRWALWTSARVDRKSRIGPALSPRVSLIFTPVPSQTLRLSLGIAYRNPTVLENYLSFTDTVTYGNARVAVRTKGDPRLEPEQARLLELAYQLERGRLRARLVGFHYRLDDLIYSTIAGAALGSLRDIDVQLAFGNQAGLSVRGGEASAEFPCGRQVTGFANYAYQDLLSGEMDPAAAAYGTPHHKFNGGLRFDAGRLSASTSMHWVSRTLWSDRHLVQPLYQRVPAYTLVTLHLDYAFGGRLRGLELGLDAFNLFNQRHYETLPSRDLASGQSGEIVGSRRTLNLNYRF